MAGIERRAGHVVENRADAVDGGKIVGILVENGLEFRDGLLAVADVFRRRRAGNILAGVGGGEIELGVRKRRIEFLGLLEILDGDVELSAFVSVDALVQQVARLELVAAADDERDASATAKTVPI